MKRPSKPQPRPRRRYLLPLSVTLLGAPAFYVALAGTAGWPLPSWLLGPGSFRRVPVPSPLAGRIVTSARRQEGTIYDARYATISYPNGDVSPTRGACTDVVIRALRGAGYDLQQLIHEDMVRHFNVYPRQGGLNHPDASIDHRRAINQIIFFKRHGQVLTNSVAGRARRQWQPGDIVYWQRGHGLFHTGVISDGVDRRGMPLVVHNTFVCVEADCLTQMKIFAHFRYPGTRPAGRVACTKTSRVPEA